MSDDNTPVIDETAPIMQSDFIKSMLTQLRALDSYGVYDGAGPAKILGPLILTPERRKEIPLIGDPDEETIARVRAYYNAICQLIERECGLMAIPLVNLTHEGFGRVLITVGKLVVHDRTLRDVHRFGFPSLSKMKDEADKVLAVAMELIGAHPQVAGL